MLCLILSSLLVLHSQAGIVCAEMEIYDLRMYVGAPLNADNFRDLAEAPTPVLDDFFKCEKLSTELTRDKPWVNGFGQNCQWLFDNKIQYPGIPDHYRVLLEFYD